MLHAERFGHVDDIFVFCLRYVQISIKSRVNVDRRIRDSRYRRNAASFTSEQDRSESRLTARSYVRTLVRTLLIMVVSREKSEWAASVSEIGINDDGRRFSIRLRQNTTSYKRSRVGR